jgi:hypothetical protein
MRTGMISKSTLEAMKREESREKSETFEKKQAGRAGANGNNESQQPAFPQSHFVL